MVNKAVVGILVLIVLTSLGVGILIGTQLGGGDGIATEPDGDAASGDGSGGDGATTTGASNGTVTDGGTVTETTATVAPTATPTPTATQTPTATPEPTRTTVAAESFDAARIEEEVVAAVNEGRAERDLYAFETGITTWNRLRTMVRYQSEGMAREDSVSFVVNGNDTKSRYQEAELYSRCRYQDPDGGNIIDPNDSFQALGKTVAGREYESGGETRFNADEREVARALVDEWFDSTTYRRPLVVEGPELFAVGVTVTENGTVYAAAAICE